MPLAHQSILTLACRDTKGIVRAVWGRLYQAGGNVIDSKPFGMNVQFHARAVRPRLLDDLHIDLVVQAGCHKRVAVR